MKIESVGVKVNITIEMPVDPDKLIFIEDDFKHVRKYYQTKRGLESFLRAQIKQMLSDMPKGTKKNVQVFAKF